MEKQNLTCSTLDAKRAEIAALHAELKSWAKVAELYPPIKRGTLQRFATSDYKPKSLAVRRALGLVRRRPSTKQIVMAALGLPWG